MGLRAAAELRMTSLANSLAGLSLLSGSNYGGLLSPLTVESRAVRLARMHFTTPVVTPVWKQGPVPASVSSILALPSLVERPTNGTLPPDVATAFTAYKALERLRALAQAGVSGTGNLQAVQDRFAAGLQELQGWMPTAPGQQLTLSFGRAARRADSLALPPAVPSELRGSKVVAERDAAIAGLDGTERFSLRLTRPGASDTFVIDLATLPQPPKLDSIANALNQAIAALPMLGSDGQPILDGSGNPVPKYQSAFAVVRHEGGGWGLELHNGGIEEVALRQDDARPTLMVAATHNVDGALAPVSLARFDLPADLLQRSPLSVLSATDLPGTTAQAPLKDGSAAPPLPAPLALAATVTDADGFTYAVGTSSGTLGSQVSDGADDLVLLKLDSRGRQVWQRSLGTSGSATGFSVALAPGGGVVVGGTAAPTGGGTDRDLLVARFGAAGEELMLAQVRQVGDEQMQGFAAASDGSMVVGGRNAEGQLSLTKLDASGKLVTRQALAPSSGTQIKGLAIAPAGEVLVLTQQGTDALVQGYAPGDLSQPISSQTLEGLNATSLAVAADGRLAVGGQRNGDGAVAIIANGGLAWANLASSGDDRIDQMLFRGDDLFVAGRTTGVLGAAKSGSVDAFIARLDAATGTVEQVQQWGRGGTRSGPVTMTLAEHGDSAVHKLGFNDGVLNPAESQKLVDLTALRPGDSFSLRVNGGSPLLVAIGADESASSFADRVSRLLGRSVGRVTIARSEGAPKLRIEPSAGHRIDLLAGPKGQDALAKLGLAPGQLIVPPPFDSKAPRVKPGGHYGLDLVEGLSLRNAASAKQALERIEGAIATVQAGFRSLYWDETKAALAEGRKSGTVSPYLGQQLARYQDALARLGG